MGAVLCSKPGCGFAVQAGGFELLVAGFPDQFDIVQQVITGATRFSVCEQCGTPNERVERIYIVLVAGARLALVRPPQEASSDEVSHLLEQVTPRVRDTWSVEVVREVGEFRTRVGLAVLAPVRFDALAEVVGAAAGDGPPPLAPLGARDRDYHAALALIGRPGVLVFQHLSEGITPEEARANLDEARRFQLIIGFFDALAETPLAGFDPFAFVEALFVPACFEDERVLETIAIVAGNGNQPGDPVVHDAALGAAAGDRRSPRRKELAHGLVRAIRRGVDLYDDPATWGRLVDAEDVFVAIIDGRSRLESEEAINELRVIGAALGHGGEVIGRYRHRMRMEAGTSLEKLLDTTFEVVSQRGSPDDVLAMVLADIAGSVALEHALALPLLVLGRLAPVRGVLALPLIGQLAKRLTNEGEPDRALMLLDEAAALLDWEAFDGHAAATGRASLLNERGNALRARLDAESALVEYEEALRRLEGLGHDDDVRSIRLNRARALRDAGYLVRAISEFRVLLTNAQGRERFDALFALGLAYQRNGQYQDAQPVFDEARELIRAEPLDDQIARFVIARQANARALGHAEEATQLIDAVGASPFASARQRLLTIAGGSIAALRVVGPASDLAATTRQLARGLGLPDLARRDAEFALLWADAARLAGDGELARETIDAALGELRQPVLGIHAAAAAAEMAIDDADWDSARSYVGRASEFMTTLFGVAASGSISVTLADTLSDLRELGVRLVTAPAGKEHDRMLSAVADLGSSLQLSATIAGEYLPSGSEWSAPVVSTVQVLQWLDGGDVHLPLLAVAGEDGMQVRRGRPVPTELVDGLGARIAGRVGRTTAMDPGDVLGGIPRFGAFQESLTPALAKLPIDATNPLTIVPSGPMAGIPIHAALPHYDVAYYPSLAVAVALAHRAAALSRQQESIGEVRCWCHGEETALIDALCEGGEALRTICFEHGALYRAATDTAATREAVAALIDASTWVKLSCHGVEKPSFALILSDGEHAPPSLTEVLKRPEKGARYLFDWNEVSGLRSRCRAVLSSACTSGSVGATRGGEQTGLARAFLMSGVLAFVAPLWPVASGPGQVFVNDLLERCLAEPGVPLATQLARTRAALRQSAPPRVVDAFVLHGFAGPINPITKEEP